MAKSVLNVSNTIMKSDIIDKDQEKKFSFLEIQGELKISSLTYKVSDDALDFDVQTPDADHAPSIDEMIDGKEAIVQAIKKNLMTERYAYVIYSDNYGFRSEDIIAKPLNLAAAMIERRVREALIRDDRIINVTNFIFEKTKKSLHVFFIVNTIFGDIQADKEIIV
ncbi:MAG: DUF2634 domain-containing protein [Eubacterium sp.]|jgi:hypothetical protein|nr:DUF2634 domain-containing protein [Eubacterium sp.]